MIWFRFLKRPDNVVCLAENLKNPDKQDQDPKIDSTVVKYSHKPIFLLKILHFVAMVETTSTYAPGEIGERQANCGGLLPSSPGPTLNLLSIIQ